MNTPRIVSPTEAPPASHRRPFASAVAAALVASSLVFSVAGPAMLANHGPSEKGPSSAVCRFWPRLCGW